MVLMIVAIGVTLSIVSIAFLYWQIRRRNMHRWLPTYLRERSKRRLPNSDEEVHLILCIADHYEPKADRADAARALARVKTWASRYPEQIGKFKDSDGRPPRYSFFFPEEEYEPEYLDLLAELCRAGFAEVELHLHHHNDTAEGFREKLVRFRDLLVNRHGLLARHRETGRIMYGFIHGNWALCNSRPDGELCGVNNELAILLETGCYADFTFPSAPNITQPAVINRIYAACDRPGEPASHETAYPLDAGPPNSIVCIQGPLVLDWSLRKLGILPSLENSCVQSTQPATLARLWNWLRARVQVPARPDWFFVKLHAHGAPEVDHEALLGEPMARFHADLAKLASDNPKFHYHYVTAREMYNLVRAAQAGFKGNVADALDWELESLIAKPAVKE